MLQNTTDAASGSIMGQHGADTTIKDITQLVIFDCYETLVHMDRRRYLPRHGILALLRHLKRARRKMVVLSDGDRAEVEKAIAEAELDSFFEEVYGRDEACQELEDGRILKRLDIPLEAHGVGAHQSVFIGDSQLDGLSAEQFQVPFIRVPRSEDVSFTFTRLIGGASRYSSAAFTEVIVDHYGKKD